MLRRNRRPAAGLPFGPGWLERPPAVLREGAWNAARTGLSFVSLTSLVPSDGGWVLQTSRNRRTYRWADIDWARREPASAVRTGEDVHDHLFHRDLKEVVVGYLTVAGVHGADRFAIVPVEPYTAEVWAAFLSARGVDVMP